jgi:hypothetical protein
VLGAETDQRDIPAPISDTDMAVPILVATTTTVVGTSTNDGVPNEVIPVMVQPAPAPVPVPGPRVILIATTSAQQTE